jgi:hypothetical protein
VAQATTSAGELDDQVGEVHRATRRRYMQVQRSWFLVDDQFRVSEMSKDAPIPQPPLVPRNQLAASACGNRGDRESRRRRVSPNAYELGAFTIDLQILAAHVVLQEKALAAPALTSDVRQCVCRSVRTPWKICPSSQPSERMLRR